MRVQEYNTLRFLRVRACACNVTQVRCLVSVTRLVTYETFVLHDLRTYGSVMIIVCQRILSHKLLSNELHRTHTDAVREVRIHELLCAIVIREVTAHQTSALGVGCTWTQSGQ